MGYEVYTSETYQHIGENKEIDFVVIKNQKISYFQFCETLDENNYKREIGNLLAIKDAYPKNIILVDDRTTKFLDGVNRINIIDFLKLEEDKV
ncbi:MAG: hypothetical protein LBC44_03795 [Mycoplasmataceae bacterium]|nr:hypothetical protein [Mycoplasmataceae bacterium]